MLYLHLLKEEKCLADDLFCKGNMKGQFNVHLIIMESESFIEYIIDNLFNRSRSGVDKPDEDDGKGKRLKITIFI